MGPGMGGGARRSGPRGAAGAGAPTGAQAWGQRPRASVSPGFARASVGWSVCLRPRAAGPCRVPGKARPAHLQPLAPGKRDRGAATRVFLVGLLASSRATGTLGDRSWELSKKPAPLPLSPPRPPPPSPIPERSSRSLAAWKARGQRGRATGEAAPRRAEGGVSFLGMGKARRGSGLECGPTLQAAPGAGHLSGAPCLPPPGSDRFFCKPIGDWTPGVRSCRLRTTGSFGGLVEGCGREERISRGKGSHGRGLLP